MLLAVAVALYFAEHFMLVGCTGLERDSNTVLQQLHANTVRVIGVPAQRANFLPRCCSYTGQLPCDTFQDGKIANVHDLPSAMQQRFCTGGRGGLAAGHPPPLNSAPGYPEQISQSTITKSTQSRMQLSCVLTLVLGVLLHRCSGFASCSMRTIGGSYARKLAAHKALSLLHPYDQMAYLLAGGIALRQVRDDVVETRMLAGEAAAVHQREMYAVRTRWMNEQLQEYMAVQHTACDQVLIVGAAMDTRAYMLGCLAQCDVYEVDEKNLVEAKVSTIQASGAHIPLAAASVQRIPHAFDNVNEQDIVQKLRQAGFSTAKPAVYIMEGFVDALRQGPAVRYLKQPLHNCAGSLLLFDIRKDSFVREPESWLACQGYQCMGIKEVVIEGRPTWLVSATS